MSSAYETGRLASGVGVDADNVEEDDDGEDGEDEDEAAEDADVEDTGDRPAWPSCRAPYPPKRCG